MNEQQEQVTRTIGLRIYKEVIQQFPYTLESSAELRLHTIENALALMICSIEGDLRTKHLIGIIAKSLQAKVNIIRQKTKELENTAKIRPNEDE